MIGIWHCACALLRRQVCGGWVKKHQEMHSCVNVHGYGYEPPERVSGSKRRDTRSTSVTYQKQKPQEKADYSQSSSAQICAGSPASLLLCFLESSILLLWKKPSQPHPWSHPVLLITMMSQGCFSSVPPWRKPNRAVAGYLSLWYYFALLFQFIIPSTHPQLDTLFLEV